MTLAETQTKFVLRSRRVGASLLAAYVALRVFGQTVGISLPEIEGPLGTLIDSFTSDDGVLARAFLLYGSVMTAGKVFGNPDLAKLSFVPFLGKRLPLGGAAALLLALVLLGAMPARADIPYQPQVRFVWTPGTGDVAGYHVRVDQGAGLIDALDVTAPEARFAVDPEGARLAVVVVPFDATGATGPPSDISEELVVLAQAPAPGAPLVTAEDGRLCLTAPTQDSLGNLIAAGAPNAILDCLLIVTDGIGHSETWGPDPYSAAQQRCFDHPSNRGAGEGVGTCRNAVGTGPETRVAVTFPPQIVYGVPGAPSVTLP